MIGNIEDYQFVMMNDMVPWGKYIQSKVSGNIPWNITRKCRIGIPWWRHQMETISALLGLNEGNPPVTGGFPHKDQWRFALMFSLICAWTNNCANKRDAGDLTPHRALYNVTVMIFAISSSHGRNMSYTINHFAKYGNWSWRRCIF